MHYEHFMITLFCFRGKNAFKHLYWPGFNFDINPLYMPYLKYRLKLFELFCLPGVLSQRDQNFTWIIIVDPALNTGILEYLKKLIAKRDRTYIVPYCNDIRLETTGWLQPYYKHRPDYIITTNHDDDDMLPASYIRNFHEHINDCYKNSCLPGIKLIGAKQIVQWDLIHSRESYFGWKSTWHRGDFPASCGFSLVSKYPQTDISVMGLVHRRAERYIDFELEPNNKHDRFHRDRIRKAMKQCQEDEKAWKKEDLFYDISQKTGPVLMSNHARNAQFARLYEKKSDLAKVNVQDDFKDFALNWNDIEKSMTLFKKDRLYYINRRLSWRYRKFRKKIRIKIGTTFLPLL